MHQGRRRRRTLGSTKVGQPWIHPVIDCSCEWERRKNGWQRVGDEWKRRKVNECWMVRTNPMPANRWQWCNNQIVMNWIMDLVLLLGRKNEDGRTCSSADEHCPCRFHCACCYIKLLASKHFVLWWSPCTFVPWNWRNVFVSCMFLFTIVLHGGKGVTLIRAIRATCSGWQTDPWLQASPQWCAKHVVCIKNNPPPQHWKKPPSGLWWTLEWCNEWQHHIHLLVVVWH